MNDIIIVNTDQCVGCNACVRVCPAPEAIITKLLDDGRYVTAVNPDRCIACGECVRSCTHGARDYADDTTEAMNAVSKREKLIILATPAIKTVFPKKWKNILNWFREHGCLIYDVSFGADICTWAHLRALQNEIIDNIITQPCAAVVKYIETYQPSLVKSLSPIQSPIMCSVIYIRRYLKLTHKIAVLSPCIAKKNEFTDTMLVDYNVTFKKLAEYFESNDIHLTDDENHEFLYDFEDEQGQVGAIYPRPGGLRDNLWMHDPELDIVSSEGVHKVYHELDMYAALSDDKKPRVFDVLSCEFGCNAGAGTDTNQTMFDLMQTMRGIEKEARSRRKINGGFFRGGEDRLFKRFDEELMLEDFIRKYRMMPSTRVPSDEELEPIFRSIGKLTKEDQNYNCHACGYASCKAMATAIYRGINTPDNCIVYAKSLMMSQHTEYADQSWKIHTISKKCRSLYERLNADVGTVISSMEAISESNSAAEHCAAVLQELLNNVIAFCGSTQTMDRDSLQALVQILEKTVTALGELSENVKNTGRNTTTVNAHISDVQQLVEDINTVMSAE